MAAAHIGVAFGRERHHLEAAGAVVLTRLRTPDELLHIGERMRRTPSVSGRGIALSMIGMVLAVMNAPPLGAIAQEAIDPPGDPQRGSSRA